MIAQTKLRNLVLDTIYKMVRQKKSNAEIRRALERALPPLLERELPAITDDWIEKMRGEFRVREMKYPGQMRGFRDRLKVA